MNETKNTLNIREALEQINDAAEQSDSSSVSLELSNLWGLMVGINRSEAKRALGELSNEAQDALSEEVLRFILSR